MTKEKTLEAVIGGFTSTILRSHFGKGPASVYVNLNDSYVCIQIKGFLSPMEKVLMNKKETQKVLETRDLLMQELTEEFKRSFWKEAELDITELYSDWNLEKKTGMILGILKDAGNKRGTWPEDVAEEDFYNEVNRISIIGQKEPGMIENIWLSDRTILIKRTEIFTLLEKELIKKGFIEPLKLAKRPLEYKLFEQSKLGAILKRPLIDTYVDWDFEEDKGYAVLVLQKSN